MPFLVSAVSCGHTKTLIYKIECSDGGDICEYVRRTQDGSELERLSVYEGVSRGFDIGINELTLDRFIECCQEE